MKKYKMKVALLILFLSTIHSYGQTQINLADTFQNNKMTAVNREISLHGENTGAIELDARDKDGLGILLLSMISNISLYLFSNSGLGFPIGLMSNPMSFL